MENVQKKLNKISNLQQTISSKLDKFDEKNSNNEDILKDSLSTDISNNEYKQTLNNRLDLIMGKINELNLYLKDKENKHVGKLSLDIHIAKMGDIPFKENLWIQKVLNIRILEGKNLPNGYLYWTGKLDNEKQNQITSSQTKEKKWIEELQIKYSYEETVILKLFEHGKKEIEIGEIKFPFNTFKH
jgi:hypothetical protein